MYVKLVVSKQGGATDLPLYMYVAELGGGGGGSNIKYSVVKVPESETADIFRDLCNEPKREGRQTARTIIFCDSHSQCSGL